MALKIQNIAADILEVQAKIAAISETLKPLKEMEDQLYEAMLSEMKTKRMDGFKTDDGINFVRSFRKGYEITDEKKAYEWAVQMNCVTLDKRKLPKFLDGTGALPEGIEYKETEVLTVKKAKDEQI